MMRCRWPRAGKATLSGVLFLGLFLGARTTTATAGEGVEVGDEVNYTFRRPLVNGLGLKSLDELRGKPVFIEFWGTR